MNPKELVEMIARLQDESETEGGYTWEDASTQLNELIAEARATSGISPGHPKLFCVECQVQASECWCDEEE